MKTAIRAGAVSVGLALAVSGGVVSASAVEAPQSAVSTVAANPENSNDPDYWEAFLEAEGYTNVECVKEDRAFTEGYTVPAGDWLLLVLKAGAGDEANDLIWNPVAGQTYMHATGKDISHVILCSGDEAEQPTEPAPTEPAPTDPAPTDPAPTDPAPTEPAPTEPAPTDPAQPTGPIVETDGVASSEGGPSAGLLGGVALLLAGGALTLTGVRRRAEH